MALFHKKNGELNFDAILWLFIGGLALRYGLKTPSPVLWALAAVSLSICAGKLWQKRWADWLALVMMGGALGLAGFNLIYQGFSWSRITFVLLSCLGLWNVWKDDIRHSYDGEDDDTENKPMISIALLLSKPRYLEDKVLAHIVESAWGGNYTQEDSPKQDGFVVGESPLYMIKSPMGMFVVHNFSRPYWDEVDKVAMDIPDLRLRKAVQEHQAWLSVDLLGSGDAESGQAASYAAIIRLIEALADETVLAVTRPATGQMCEWSDDVLEALLRPNGEASFHRSANIPIVEVSADDPAMKAAVAEARRCWPEFVSAFASRQPQDVFSVKAPVTRGETTEFIWLEVTGLEPDYIHGRLSNAPLALEGLKLGSQIEVPVSEINDWVCVTGDGGPKGGFTIQVVMSRERASH